RTSVSPAAPGSRATARSASDNAQASHDAEALPRNSAANAVTSPPLPGFLLTCPSVMRYEYGPRCEHTRMPSTFKAFLAVVGSLGRVRGQRPPRGGAAVPDPGGWAGGLRAAQRARPAVTRGAGQAWAGRSGPRSP